MERRPLVFHFQYRSSPKYQQYQKDAGLSSTATRCAPSCRYQCRCPASLQTRRVWLPSSDDHCQTPQFLKLIHTHNCPAQFYTQSNLNSPAKKFYVYATYLNCVAFEVAVPREIFLAQENELGPVWYVLFLKCFFSFQCDEFAHGVNILDDQILLDFFRLLKC